MVDWPDLGELKQTLDVTSDDWDGAEESGGSTSRLTRVLAAAIAQVKADAGGLDDEGEPRAWDDDIDLPDESLSQAALTLAVDLWQRPEETTGPPIRNATYNRLLKGHRRVFGIA